MDSHQSPYFSGVTTGAERRQAAGHWLLSSAEDMPHAQNEWKQKGAAWLRPGAMYAAVMIPAYIVHAAVGLNCPRECAPPLADALERGPVFYSPEDFQRKGAYTALLPAGAARTWNVAGTVLHTPESHLLVPSPERRDPAGRSPWWVEPLDGPGLLCEPRRVAALVAVGRDNIGRPGGGPRA